MSILEFASRRDGAFDDELTRFMGEAFDAACARFTKPSYAIREAIAHRIIETAKRGERDPVRLRDAGIAAVKRP
jgi:hypothetical protein